jgi:hypothetical protein
MFLPSTLCKMVLVSIIAILSIAILALPAAAKGPGKKELLIEAVYVNFDDQNIVIFGQNFVDKKKETVVQLSSGITGLSGELNIMTFDENYILASLPDEYIIAPGDYLLSVTCGKGEKDYDNYGLTIGAVGPQGEQGETGLTGAQGIKGDTGLQVLRVCREYQERLLLIVLGKK